MWDSVFYLQEHYTISAVGQGLREAECCNLFIETVAS